MSQARRSQQQVHSLQAENQSLQLHLEDAQRHCRQLEDTARTHTQVSAPLSPPVLFCLSPSLSVSHPVCLSVRPAGGAVRVEDGGPSSERQTGGERRTAGGAGGGAPAAEGGAKPTGDTGTGETGVTKYDVRAGVYRCLSVCVCVCVCV